MARDLTRTYLANAETKAPAHVLFPQLREVVDRYLREKVEAVGDFEPIDALLIAPFYGHVLERISQAIHPDSTAGESHEVPRYERARETGSTADVDWWTSKDVRVTTKSHINYMVADTKQREQSGAYHIERHRQVVAWVKNAGLNFTIPYTHNGQDHDYLPDFLVRFDGNDFTSSSNEGLRRVDGGEAGRSGALVAAVNADGRHGRWRYGRAEPQRCRLPAGRRFAFRRGVAGKKQG
jgi:type III restriction enzyme